MHRAFPILLIGLLISSAASGQDTPKPAASDLKAEKCSVAGTVVRKGSNEPIHFAHITLTSDGDEQKSLHGTTAADGRFTFKDVPPGDYRVSVTRNGYMSESYGSRRPTDPGVPLTLSSGKHVDDLVFRMTPAAIITGHVRDENGEALPWAQVTALITFFVQRKRTLMPVSSSATNDLGEYRLFNLPPGKYLLSAGYEMSQSMGIVTATALRNRDEREGLTTTYYPGTSDPLQAAIVNVEPGAEIRSMDFSLRPSGVFHIRGHVSGLAVGFNGAVMLRKGNSRLSAAMPERTAAVKNEDGTFDIDQVASGSYEIIAIEFARDTPRMAHRPVEVGGADVDGMDLAFESGVTVTGHLRWEDKAAAPNVPLQVSLEQDGQIFNMHPTAEVQPDGSFELKNVSVDSYRVNVTGPAPDAYLKTARYGSSDALHSFRVSSGSEAILELVGSTRGARIQGVVMNSDPVPASDVWVTLIPEDSNQKRLFQSVRSREDGKFEFRGVAPGNYLLFSWDNVEEHEWDDPEFLKPFKSQGVSVRVTEGETKTTHLTVIRTESEEATKPQ
ncbi:MAG TPA: carboxypeptidase-like regulatory domain-containing protein [Candidatus Acidoferrum sp.]